MATTKQNTALQAAITRLHTTWQSFGFKVELSERADMPVRVSFPGVIFPDGEYAYMANPESAAEAILTFVWTYNPKKVAAPAPAVADAMVAAMGYKKVAA